MDVLTFSKEIKFNNLFYLTVEGEAGSEDFVIIFRLFEYVLC